MTAWGIQIAPSPIQQATPDWSEYALLERCEEGNLYLFQVGAHVLPSSHSCSRAAARSEAWFRPATSSSHKRALMWLMGPVLAKHADRKTRTPSRAVSDIVKPGGPCSVASSSQSPPCELRSMDLAGNGLPTRCSPSPQARCLASASPAHAGPWISCTCRCSPPASYGKRLGA
jgi:hypothetical protein